MECTPWFNRKGRRVDNLRSVRFSHNGILQVVGYGLTVDSNILDLTQILCRNIVPERVCINVNVCRDNALLLDL
jgi:hypothetical protein